MAISFVAQVFCGTSNASEATLNVIEVRSIQARKALLSKHLPNKFQAVIYLRSFKLF